MPSTVNVNSRSVVHASSAGMSQAFPDVCKTPAPPAPSPVPIPYPNIAMSSDTDGTASVKANGASVMVKGSNFRMSSGDEAGVALGVVSNKIKGKAEFTMYSFDVKFEGNNACRLSDPMQQNMGSGNAFGPAELQAMIKGLVLDAIDRVESCVKQKKNEKEQQKKGGSSAAWEKSGIVSGHRGAIQDVVTKQHLKVIFRSTKKECGKWINEKYQPKPHDIINGTTITRGGKVTFAHAAGWLESYAQEREKNAALGKAALDAFDATKGFAFHTYVSARPTGIRGGDSASDFEGIVGSTQNFEYGRPLLANKMEGEFAKNSYVDKYVTGDYDLQDVIADRSLTCKRVLQDGDGFAQFRLAVNKKMGWDGIQHGPQAQWVAQVKKGDASDFSMPLKLQTWLKADRGSPVPQVEIGKNRMADIIDKELTVVSPKGATSLNNHDEVRDYLVCCGCKKPSKGVD